MKPRVYLSKEVRENIRTFVDSPETQTVISDPKAQQAIEDSARAVRELAETRSRAREIPDDIRLAVIGPGCIY